MSQHKDDIQKAFTGWYDSLKKNKSGLAPKGTIAGALVVLENLKNEFDLDIDAHTAEGGAQISGTSGSAVRRILEQFGETRPFVSEGGRTNRGLRGAIKNMLDAIRNAGLQLLNEGERTAALEKMQSVLVEKVHDFHSQKRLEVIYNAANSTWQLINDLLDKAREADKEGAVAQYIVGAKLQLRFPGTEVSNDSYSTADVQLGRKGDFLIGDTVLHVTVAPMPAVYDKCQRNLIEGYKVYLLVRERSVVGTKQNADSTAPGQITVESIESFVSQNIDELSVFSRGEHLMAVRRLLDTYNKRVDAVENDKSMMVEIPPNLPDIPD